MPPTNNILLDLPNLEITEVFGNNHITLRVVHNLTHQCPHCGGTNLRKKDTFIRMIQHILYGQRPSWLEGKTHKYMCRVCRKYFNTRFTGIRLRKRSTEPFRLEITKLIGKDKVRVMVMDLSEGYRSLAKKYFTSALIVADRFHVIRL